MAARPQGVEPEGDLTYRQGKALADAQRYGDAVPHLIRAANGGHAAAQYLLGRIYQHGHPGIPPDPGQARHWFSMGAEQGDRSAQYELGVAYERGELGAARDARKALDLLKASAEQGLGKAQYALGLLCEFDLGDRPGAMRWLEQAGSDGEIMAQWAAAWLRRSDTPHFRSEAEFASYVNTAVAGWIRGPSRLAAGDDKFVERFYLARTRMLYERQGREAGDRCRLDGACY
jgi:TPR repeat protein